MTIPSRDRNHRFLLPNRFQTRLLLRFIRSPFFHQMQRNRGNKPPLTPPPHSSSNSTLLIPSPCFFSPNFSLFLLFHVGKSTARSIDYLTGINKLRICRFVTWLRWIYLVSLIAAYRLVDRRVYTRACMYKLTNSELDFCFRRHRWLRGRPCPQTWR